MRYVELIRVSTVKQAKQDTPEAQRQALERLRQFRPGTLVERIEAPGISGALSLRDRPDLTRLVELAKAKAFDEIRVYSVDRLTRAEDPRERVAVLGIALDAHASIVDASGHTIDPTNDVGELDWYLQSLFAARERKKILQRSKDGQVRAAKEGRHPQGRLPYGLRYDKKAKAFSWDPDEAAAIKEMIEGLGSGGSLVTVSAALNARGVRTHGKGRWSHGRVRTVVRNGHVLGVWVHSGIPIRVPRLIEDEPYERALAALERNRKNSGNRVPRNLTMLRGMLKCAECGSQARVLTRVKKDGSRVLYYVCGRWIGGDKTGHRGVKFIQAKDQDASVLRSVRDVLSDPETIAGALKRQRKDAPSKTKAAAGEDARLAGEEDRVLRLLERGVLSEDRAAERLRQLKEKRTGLKAKLTEEARQAASRPNPERVAPSAESIKARLDAATPEDLARLCRMLFPDGLLLFADGHIEGDGVLPLVSAVDVSSCRSAHRGHAPIRLVACR